MIPEFDENGDLPAGVHDATWDELAARYGTDPRRLRLLAGLKRALDVLAAGGCRRAYVDGSFVTDEPEPNDFDACWEPAGVDAALLDPVLLDFSSGRADQKAKYGGELFPAEWGQTPPAPAFSTTSSRTRAPAIPRASSPSTLEVSHDR